MSGADRLRPKTVVFAFFRKVALRLGARSFAESATPLNCQILSQDSADTVRPGVQNVEARIFCSRVIVNCAGTVAFTFNWEAFRQLIIGSGCVGPSPTPGFPKPSISSGLLSPVACEDAVPRVPAEDAARRRAACTLLPILGVRTWISARAAALFHSNLLYAGQRMPGFVLRQHCRAAAEMLPATAEPHAARVTPPPPPRASESEARM